MFFIVFTLCLQQPFRRVACSSKGGREGKQAHTIIFLQNIIENLREEAVPLNLFLP